MSKSNARKAASQPIPETRAMDIPFNQLRLSDKNVRNIYEPKTVAQLAESIATNGLIQSLSARPLYDEDGNETGNYEVQAGGRRYRALELLVKKNRRPADHPTPCVVKSNGFAEDDSYIENSQREALHPIDEFRAFKAMLQTGKSEAQIASTHKVSVAFVRQRLRLASASPTILQAFRDEKLTLEQLMAFCIVDDHARQEAVWERVQKDYYSDAYYIRNMMTEDDVKTSDSRVTFIGLEAYEKAGGIVERDLFSDKTEGFLKDADLLNKLVIDKLEAERQALLAAGWSWVEANSSIPYDRKQGLDRLLGEEPTMTKAEEKQLAKLNKEREALDALDEWTDEQDARNDELENLISAIEDKPLVFSKEQMASGGAFLSIGHDGHLRVDLGYVRADDRHEADTQTGCDEEPNAGAEESEQPSNKPLSGSLIQDLTSYRTVALRNELAQNFDVAFVSVVHAMALTHFYTFHSNDSCLQLKLDTSFPAKAPGLESWGYTQAIEHRDMGWRKALPKEPDALWQSLLDMKESDLKHLFSYLASLAVNAVNSAHYHRKRELAHAETLATTLKLDMAKAGWTNTAETYLGRVSKPRILEAVTEACGEDTATLISELKKDKMVKEAERLLDGTGWLPEVLRTRTSHDTPITVAIDSEAEANEPESLPEFLAENTDANQPAAVN